MRAFRLWFEGFLGVVIALAEAVDELAGGAVLDGGLSDAVLFGVRMNSWTILDVLLLFMRKLLCAFFFVA